MTTPPASARHARTAHSHGVLRAVGLVLTGALVFVATGAGAAYYKLQHNIDSIDVSHMLVGADDLPSAPAEDPLDPNAGLPVNILLMGSDDRSGTNAAIGGEAEGMRSDTTIVMHISADRSRVELVSIPRDSLVDIPSCTMSDGTTTKAKKNSMFNGAFATGYDVGGDIDSAAACTMLTVMSLTDVYLDGFVVVDFAGFEDMIDALRGVPMCIEEKMVSPEANLYLEAGPQTLNGAQALALARARKGDGLDGSDLQRITRQQELLGATARTVLDRNLLTNAPSLLQFLDAATSSLTASQEFASLQNLTGLALTLRNIDPAGISFLTIPVVTAPTDKNRVVWSPAADEVWANLAADLPIDGSGAQQTPSATETPSTESPTTTETTEPTQTATTQAPPAGLTSAADAAVTCG